MKIQKRTGAQIVTFQPEMANRKLELNFNFYQDFEASKKAQASWRTQDPKRFGETCCKNWNEKSFYENETLVIDIF